MKMVNDLKQFLARCEEIPSTPRGVESNDQDIPIPDPFTLLQQSQPIKLPEATE